MTHGSLFSGIGGFDLAAEWMGWENKFHCELNPFGQKVLKHYWPNAESFDDITKTDFKKYNGTIDIISGGFPCQPYSQAGKRLGKEDDRHLWPEMLRAIREIQPGWVVGENVRGLTNWNGGMVFDEVQADLEAEGYEIIPFLLPACAVNAPHRRDRIWFIAYSKSLRSNRTKKLENSKGQSGEWGGCDINNIGKIRQGDGNEFTANPSSNRPTENTDSIRWAGNIGQEEPNERKQREFSTGNNERIRTDNAKTGDASNTSNERLQGGQFDGTFEQGNRGEQPSRPVAKFYQVSNWLNFPTQPPLCGRDDGISTQLAGITFPKHRNESIKGYGNAIVPQVAHQIFKAIEQYENLPK